MNWKIFYRLAVTVGLLIASAISRAEEIKSPLPIIKEGVLANGFSYTLVPLAGQKKRVDIRLSVEAGSVDERDDESGAAHMVEHMVFRASTAFPQGVSTALHQAGWVRAQHYNAMTNYERTTYMMSPPAGGRDLAFTLQALNQMVGHASLLPGDLNDERKIIFEEWRGKLGVAERMNQQRVQAIRHGSRYPSRPVMGTEPSIKNMPASTLRTFYQRWYRPANMRLLLIGDVRIEEAEREITRIFSTLPNVAVPQRDDYEPRLQPQLNVTRLQDSQSGSSQVSFVYRFEGNDANGQSSLRHRLLNQITLSALTRQVRRQKATLPPEVGSLVVRKADIGKTTVALGFFADVMPGGHDVALSVLLQELERVKRYPLRERDIIDLKAEIREAAQRMINQPEERNFADWVQQLATVWLQGRRYVGSQQRGREVMDILASITPQEVNKHLQNWLSATDTLVQFSVPGVTPFTLPQPDAIRARQQQWAMATLTPPRVPEAKVIPELPSVAQGGKRTAVKIMAEQHVEQWQLSNGDRLVWLRTPQADQKIYLTAMSQAGYMASSLNPWQSQLASQLISQSGPADWRAQDLKNWKQERSLALSIDQDADRLTISGQAPVGQLAELLGLYRALNISPGIDPAVMKESMMRLVRQRISSEQSVTDRRAREIAELRFGHPAWQAPEITQLKQLTASTLMRQWHQASAAPVTYYLLADMSAEQLLAQVERYLASIPRRPIAEIRTHLAREGRREVSSPIGIEPRADIRSWSFTPYTWTPQAAVQVSIARNLADKYLKASLRDDALGIYRMRLESGLEDGRQRIETEVSFTSAPERAQELWQRAERVFAELSAKITPEDVDEQKQQFIRAEQGRRHDIPTLQRRLILSYRHYDDPRYLTDVGQLADSVTLDGVRAMSTRLFNPQNSVLYISLPREAQE